MLCAHMARDKKSRSRPDSQYSHPPDAANSGDCFAIARSFSFARVGKFGFMVWAGESRQGDGGGGVGNEGQDTSMITPRR